MVSIRACASFAARFMGAPLLHVGGVFFAGLLSWRRFANERAACDFRRARVFSLSKREIRRKKKTVVILSPRSRTALCD
jgi:hypothetical protein